jgi:hypothetical protein
MSTVAPQSRITNRDLFALTLRYAMESDLAIERYAKYRGEKTPSLFGDDDKPSWIKGGTATKSSEWDESKHPRVEKGSKSAHGGQFTSGKQQGLAGLSMADAVGVVGKKSADDHKKAGGIESNEKLPLFDDRLQSKNGGEAHPLNQAGLSPEATVSKSDRLAGDKSRNRSKEAPVFGVIADRVADWHARAMGPGLKAFDQLNEQSRKLFGESFSSFMASNPYSQSIAAAMEKGGPLSDPKLLSTALGMPEDGIKTLLERLGDETSKNGYSNPVAIGKHDRQMADSEKEHQETLASIASNNKRKAVEKLLDAGRPVSERAMKDYPDLMSRADKAGLVLERQGIAMPSKTIPNDEAKPGDQLGLFGDATKAPKTAFKPKLIDQPAKQGGLFDTKGNPDQMDLFGDGVMPDELVYKSEQKKSDEVAKNPDDAPKPKMIEALSDRIQDFGEKIGGARKDRAKPTGPRAAKPKAEGEDDSPKGWRSRYEVSQVDKSSGKSEEGKWVVYDKRQNTWYGQPKQIGVFASKEEAHQAVPLAEVSRNHVVRNLSRGDETANYAIVRKVSDTKHPTIKDGFKSNEEAMKYLATHPEEIIEHKTAITDAMIHPAIDNVTRKGEDRRGGKPSTPESFKKFGFRGVEFGNWNNNAETKAILNHADDAMSDLADVLKLKPSDISLGGDLGLGFGSRGQGLSGAKAHYEPDYAAINLTKLSGAGSLAHEWAHALDHYLGRQSGKAEGKRTENEDKDLVYKDADATDFVSHGHRRSNKLSPGYDPELKQAFDNVMSAIQYKPTQYTEDATKHDKFHKRRVEDLNKELDDLRESFAKDHSNASYKPYRGARNNAPLPAEQMKEVDSIIKGIKDKIESGEFGESDFIRSAKSPTGGPLIHKVLHRLNEIHKEHRGRNAYHTTGSGYSSRHDGPVVRISSYLSNVARSKTQLDSAKSGEVKTANVRTDFHNMAKSMDNGTVKDYWSTPHELFARALDSYIYDKMKNQGNHNDFLAHEKHNDKPLYRMFGVKPFPEGDEKQKIDTAIDGLLEKLRNHKHIAEPERVKYQVAFAPMLLEHYSEPSRPFTDDGDLLYDPIREQYASALSCLVERYEWTASLHPRDKVGRFTKTRQLADHPDLQSHHSLNIKNQDQATARKLNDHRAGFRNLLANATRKAQFQQDDPNYEPDEETVWANVDKTALQAMLAKINQADHESLKGDGPKFHELVNANQIIPKMVAERLHGGSRFFDPEKLRGRWNEPSPQTAPPQEQKQDTLLSPQEMGQPSEIAPEKNPQPKSQPQPQESPQQPDKPKRAQVTPEAMQGMFGDKLPKGVSKAMNARLERSIRNLTGDDPEMVKAFKSVVFDAWKQMTQEVNDHNQAIRQVTNTAASLYDSMGHDTDSVSGAPQKLTALVRMARNGSLDPSQKKGFDLMVDNAQRNFPQYLAGRGEDGFMDWLKDGIKPQPSVIDPEVAERAVSLAGAEFFKQFDQGEPPEQDEPQSEDDWNDQFSWSVARAMVERYRREIAIERYGCEPTPAQRIAGNYKMTHVRVHGLPISIETKKGEKRRPEWPTLAADYGYFKKTTGRDGDHIDVFVGPDKLSEMVFVIDQVGLNGKFDEHKVLLGFANQADAIATYRKCYHNGWKVGPVTSMTIAQFKNWIASGKHSRPIAKQVSRYSFAPTLLESH